MVKAVDNSMLRNKIKRMSHSLFEIEQIFECILYILEVNNNRVGTMYVEV